MHYTLILSPEGSNLLRMMENIHRLLPYTLLRQTLKIGNVATMLSALMKVILAKASVSMVTNWIGLTSGANEGMNLLQQIVSQVLSWEMRDLRNRSDKIERSNADATPPKAVREALRSWANSRQRQEHIECRRMSRDQQMSIVAVILALSPGGLSADDLTEAQHSAAQTFLTLQLSIRDRKEIIRVLCDRNPDHLTAALQEGVAAYTPMIRRVHRAVNLADTMWDFERFVTDLLKTARPWAGGKNDSKTPAVEDFVDLLHRHQTSCHKFLHQVAKNDKEVLNWWREYVKGVIRHFRSGEAPPSSQSVVPDAVVAGGLQKRLEAKFDYLSIEDQENAKSELDAHARYLSELHAASEARIAAVIRRTRTTPFGPGAYLARWQDLLDQTPITPATAHGAVRYGSREIAKVGDQGSEESKSGSQQMPRAPDVTRVIETFSPEFRRALTGDESIMEC